MSAGSGIAQPATVLPQLVLDNEFVRILRVTVPPGSEVELQGERDTVAVRLEGETVRFISKGDHLLESNSAEHETVDLLVEVKRHWEAEMRPCSAPMRCTRETLLGNEPIAWTTTLFTNGFVTASKHRVVRGGTLTSSYYSAKGADRVILVPFTSLDANFGGIQETLKAGQPYFSSATEVEVTGKDAESRWFVLRLNMPGK